MELRLDYFEGSLITNISEVMGETTEKDERAIRFLCDKRLCTLIETRGTYNV